MDRRTFLLSLSAAGAASALTLPDAFGSKPDTSQGDPARIVNEFVQFLPGEREALQRTPALDALEEQSATLSGGRQIAIGEHADGWTLLSVLDINGVATAVFEKSVTHRSAIAYVTVRGGTIARVPKLIGDLSKVRPRPIPAVGKQRLRRPLKLTPGPDTVGDFLLSSSEDPSYEIVAACGEEYIGWSLVSADGAGPERSIYLEADGRSRQPAPGSQIAFAPDLEGPLFDPEDYFPFAAPEQYAYTPGYSKRTLLGGYLPVAATGVWNPVYRGGYELIMLLPNGPDTKPMARMRVRLTAEDTAAAQHGNIRRDPQGNAYVDHFWHCSPESFYSALAGVWNYWHELYEQTMPVSIPDPWLLDAARAGITLSRCSYRGLEPTYQVGEGAYTKIPERSHALFPVAHYEFIWAQQLWGLGENCRPYSQNYLEKYVLQDGNFTYNTQDQVEGPMNVGLFLWNASRDFFYSRDSSALLKERPVLERMLGYVLKRYEYGKQRFPASDRRHGLIWGSPEADLGDPANDFPDSHPFYYQNAACVWRGLHEYANALQMIGSNSSAEVASEGKRYAAIAEEMRGLIQKSLEATIAAGTPAMRRAGITPFEPNDILRNPADLSSYENHRFMMDWFLADWGIPSLDEGHLKHRVISGEQMIGLHTDGLLPRTSNFMEHGTLAAKIRRDDYRSYLLTLYALCCYAADSGNRYAPEDAYIPGSYPGEQSKYGWSAVINSTLQPTMGLRWLLCYEESDQNVLHLQKAAPKHWFHAGESISVQRCPTRFGTVSWSTAAHSDTRWQVALTVQEGFLGSIYIHIRPPASGPLTSASLGKVQGNFVLLTAEELQARQELLIDVTA